jgi:hypothetical protein
VRVLARRGEPRVDALERAVQPGRRALARRAAVLHPVRDHPDHCLEKGERVGRLQQAGLWPATLLVHAHQSLDLLGEGRRGALLAHPMPHHLRAAVLVPAVVGRVVPARGRIPTRSAVREGALDVVRDGGDANRFARIGTEPLDPPQRALEMTGVRMHVGDPDAGALPQLAHAVTRPAWRTYLPPGERAADALRASDAAVHLVADTGRPTADQRLHGPAVHNSIVAYLSLVHAAGGDDHGAAVRVVIIDGQRAIDIEEHQHG